MVNVEYATNKEIKLKWKDESDSCPPEDYNIIINGVPKIGKQFIKELSNPANFSATFNLKNQKKSSQFQRINCEQNINSFICCSYHEPEQICMAHA